METKTSSSFWWMKESKSDKSLIQDLANKNIVSDEISSSLAEFLEKERDLEYLEGLNQDEDIDIGSILEEISRLSAKSPLGPYERGDDRSIEDIMREAEKIYMESSKSFEQLSQRSKTSQNITDAFDGSDKSDSTPTPKSVSPLPLDNKEIEEDTYSDDFSEKSEIAVADKNDNNLSADGPPPLEEKVADVVAVKVDIVDDPIVETFKGEIVKKDEVIKLLIGDNRGLKEEIKSLEVLIGELRHLYEQTQILKSPESNAELLKALDELKDSREINTALQLQLDGTNKSHQILKSSHDELVAANKNLERKLLDVDSVLEKYKAELQSAQKQRERLHEAETNVAKLLDSERTQIKKLKLQTEKDSKCITDLNRQIKEMERIITRKHPDSVSALIVAAKSEDNSPTARRVLEDRIKSLEQEALLRDAQNSQVFIDVHDKFNQMKLKYESHIDDLELHVSDLKLQLKRRVDTYDVYTQTVREDQKIPAKDTSNAVVQTDPIKLTAAKVVAKKPPPEREVKEETHLLATIRGFQADLSNKEKVIVKLQKEVDELRKTNRRLQKEREGSLKNLTGSKEFRSYPDKLSSAQASHAELRSADVLGDELRAVKTERDKMKLQLCRIEEDYQALKAKRLQDLNTLQEAHEREISTYLANITPLREQLEVQQVTVSALQQQLMEAKQELAVVTVERDHLNNKTIRGVSTFPDNFNGNEDCDVATLRKRIAHLESRYEEREDRLRVIVHGLAQKSVTNRSCEQCAALQQQLIGYKVELDQLIATVRSLQ